jgi:predicted acylesterase/phospholipase RssA
MPAGLFSLDAYERFLEDNFVRRGVPNQFSQLPRRLRVLAHDLDSGEPAVFGAPGLDHVPITRACIASMATPPLFSPVRIGNNHYINPAPSQIAHTDLAVELGAKVIVVVNPMVPLKVNCVPTGHGVRASVRDKGAMWVANQSNRIKLHALLSNSIRRIRERGDARVVVVEPEPTDGTLFMHNPASFAARRAILETSYLSTRELASGWLRAGELPLSEAGWHSRPVDA